ncbi:MAG TPA: discoidin domain-containing protein [Verrucomicrobiales bacterium]|nr:discoidin domain-containing protein [Verrucomicrobiales bacterium]
MRPLFCLTLSTAALTTQARATILAAPLVTDSAPAFNATTFVAPNAVDGTSAEYASSGQGTLTFLQFTFPAPATFNSIVVINRDSAGFSDRIGNFTLTYDGGPASTAITRTPLRGASLLHPLGSNVTATTVRLTVNSIGTGDAFNNTGAMEVLFVRRPDGMLPVTGVSIFGSATAFNGNYAATNAIDGEIGRSTAAGDTPEYASQSLGLGAFVDFDMGAIRPLSGFDWFDRPAAADRVTGFDMIFSQDAVFGNGDDITRPYTNSGMALGDTFAPINARYVRYDVTASGAGLNTGLSEIYFYQVPEPSSAALLLAGVLLMRRRRASLMEAVTSVDAS